MTLVRLDFRPSCAPFRQIAVAVGGGLAVVLVAVATDARAAPSIGAASDPSPIYGGHSVARCAWPTSVSMAGVCSGTLIHPEVVVYAAHCGDAYPTVRLGEATDEPARSVATEFCSVYPDGGPGTGRDVAVCKLAEPVVDVEIVPPLMGCETDILSPGREVVLVGYGKTDDGTYGVKYEVAAPLLLISDEGEALIGGDGVDTCQGDSGGPVFVRLPRSEGGDDTWRVFGITSYGDGCGSGGYYSMMHRSMAWIESETGVDVTPCHDADGSWNPGPGCGRFPRDPGDGRGTWAEGCDPGELGGASATCGEVFDPSSDTTPPTVTITSPVDLADFVEDEDGATIIEVAVEADDGSGFGVARVELLKDGTPLAGSLRTRPPWVWSTKVTRGTHVLVARAQDAVGNVGESTPIEISVDNDGLGCAQDRRGAASGSPSSLVWLSMARRRSRKKSSAGSNCASHSSP